MAIQLIPSFFKEYHDIEISTEIDSTNGRKYIYLTWEGQNAPDYIRIDGLSNIGGRPIGRVGLGRDDDDELTIHNDNSSLLFSDGFFFSDDLTEVFYSDDEDDLTEEGTRDLTGQTLLLQTELGGISDPTIYISNYTNTFSLALNSSVYIDITTSNSDITTVDMENEQVDYTIPSISLEFVINQRWESVVYQEGEYTLINDTGEDNTNTIQLDIPSSFSGVDITEYRLVLETTTTEDSTTTEHLTTTATNKINIHINKIDFKSTQDTALLFKDNGAYLFNVKEYIDHLKSIDSSIIGVGFFQEIHDNLFIPDTFNVEVIPLGYNNDGILPTISLLDRSRENIVISSSGNDIRIPIYIFRIRSTAPVIIDNESVISVDIEHVGSDPVITQEYTFIENGLYDLLDLGSWGHDGNTINLRIDARDNNSIKRNVEGEVLTETTTNNFLLFNSYDFDVMANPYAVVDIEFISDSPLTFDLIKLEFKIGPWRSFISNSTHRNITFDFFNERLIFDNFPAGFEGDRVSEIAIVFIKDDTVIPEGTVIRVNGCQIYDGKPLILTEKRATTIFNNIKTFTFDDSGSGNKFLNNGYSIYLRISRTSVIFRRNQLRILSIDQETTDQEHDFNIALADGYSNGFELEEGILSIPDPLSEVYTRKKRSPIDGGFSSTIYGIKRHFKGTLYNMSQTDRANIRSLFLLDEFYFSYWGTQGFILLPNANEEFPQPLRHDTLGMGHVFRFGIDGDVKMIRPGGLFINGEDLQVIFREI